MEENKVPQSTPKLIEQRVFNALLNRLLFNTGFHVAASVKEKPRHATDFTVYLVNLIVNNSTINANSEFMAVLNANCHEVQVSNDARFPGQLLIVCEMYVVPAVEAAPSQVKAETTA